jgi:uncharacterized protein (DUF362 family)
LLLLNSGYCVTTPGQASRAKAFIGSLTHGYGDILQAGFEFCGGTNVIGSGDRVCIKPNLTFPHFRKGVMTTPEAVEALIVFLKCYTDKITICESDSGGYNRFSMDEVFRATGIAEMARRYGVRVVNMSYEPSRNISVRAGLRKLSVPLPTLLLEGTDLFITVPVPKVHMNTVVSIAVKNQWGVIQEPATRLKLHPYFKEVIYQVNKSMPRSFAFVDAKYALTRSGPLRGDAVEWNWAMVTNSIFYADLIVTALMGLSVDRIPYLAYIFRKEEIRSLDEVTFNSDVAGFRRAALHLRREWTDYPGLLTFNSRLLAYIGYESALAKPLHWLLYRFREPFF